MCIAIYIPEGKDITEEALQLSYENNPHGCGLAYVSKAKEIVINYRDMEFERFCKMFRHLQNKNPESPFFIHLRKKTHGEVTIDNCHPFRIDNEHIFMHNGTIYPEVPKDKEGKVSDTVNFNTNILKTLPKGWMKSLGITKMIKNYLGNSRIAVMNNKGEVVIYNEFKEGAHGAAHWFEGVWYSNAYYKTPPFKARNFQETPIRGFGIEKAVGLIDLDFIPEGATFVNTKGYACRWNASITSLEAWDPEEKHWRAWDALSEWFKWGTSNRKTVSNLGYAKSLGKLVCDSCRSLVFWYDLDEYTDEWGNVHNLCEVCASDYEKVGMKLAIKMWRARKENS